MFGSNTAREADMTFFSNKKYCNKKKKLDIFQLSASLKKKEQQFPNTVMDRSTSTKKQKCFLVLNASARQKRHKKTLSKTIRIFFSSNY